MKANKSTWLFTDGDFGPLLPYIEDDNITDINYNGREVWVDDLRRGRYRPDVVLDKDFVERFSVRVADVVSKKFNQYHPLLEAETDTLRISIVHEEVANTGRSISIRKTPAIRRLSREKMVSEDYCTDEILDFIESCVKGKMNILMCGLPGTGKTEFLKYLTSFIPANERVITIEDNLEIRYSEINPGKDCVEMKVTNDSDRFDYVKAIKACLRQAPQWILLSEARSTEVKYLMESMSTGTHCLTTIHTDDVRKVPDRIKNMVQDSYVASRIENDVFSFLDAAVLIRKGMKDGHIHRYIDQFCFFSREEGTNVTCMVIEDGQIINKELPFQILRKFSQNNITNPFERQLDVDMETEYEISKEAYESEVFPSIDESITESKNNENTSLSSATEESQISEQESAIEEEDSYYDESLLSEGKNILLSNIIELNYKQHQDDNALRQKFGSNNIIYQ